jgi:hypothetical protein
MLPSHVDGRSHIVSQHDELFDDLRVMGAKTYDVYPRTADQIDIRIS